MVEKKVEPRQPSSGDATTQPVVDLLASILKEVKQQVQVKAAESLTGEAQRAVALFKEIDAALALQARPTITLIANPPNLPGFGTVRLTWASTGAETVSIAGVDANGTKVTVGEVTPAAGGTTGDISVSTTTIFTATATGRCSTSATVTVGVSGPL